MAEILAAQGLIVHHRCMTDKLGGFEESAGIVEAFAESQEGEMLEFLPQIVKAIRDRATDS
jgi:hypothetical protein